MVTTNIPFNIPLFSLGSIYSTNASGVEQMTETNNSNIIEYNRAKNTNWQETNQLAIYKRDGGCELALPRTNPASGQSGTWTRDLRIASPALKPLGHAASYDLIRKLESPYKDSVVQSGVERVDASFGSV